MIRGNSTVKQQGQPETPDGQPTKVYRPTAALVVDESGFARYRIVTTTWANAIVALLFVLTLIVVMLVGLIFWNSMRINKIEREDSNQNGQTIGR